MTLEIEEAQNLILEFVGEPLSKKKDAAESAAEGAFWYLQHEGYLPSIGNWHIAQQLSCHINPKAIGVGNVLIIEGVECVVIGNHII